MKQNEERKWARKRVWRERREIREKKRLEREKRKVAMSSVKQTRKNRSFEICFSKKKNMLGGKMIFESKTNVILAKTLNFKIGDVAGDNWLMRRINFDIMNSL